MMSIAWTVKKISDLQKRNRLENIEAIVFDRKKHLHAHTHTRLVDTREIY